MARRTSLRQRAWLLLIFLLSEHGLLAQSSQPVSAAEVTPSAQITEHLVSFEVSSVMLRWERPRWLLMAGERVLKDFGRRENEARLALRLIQELNLNQYGTVSSPSPILEYWLSNGQAPAGFAPGLRRLAMDTATLRVEHVQAQWCLRDARRTYFNFGFHGEEARQALAILRKYGFTDIGIIGSAQPSMLIFLASSRDTAPHVPITPASRVHKTAYTSENVGQDKGRVNTNPGAGLGTIVTPVLPPLAGTGSPHGPRLAFGRETMKDDRRAAARLGNSGSPLPGWDERIDCVPFNWRQVRMRQDNGAWQLAAGNYVLASFGDDELAARQALAVLHHYRFTEHYRIGHPQPSFSFFLINGQPPLGLMFGLGGQAFQHDKLSVQKLGTNWSLCEGDRVLVMLGDKPDEARQLLDLIHLHKFDRLCRIGSPEQGGMTFLVRSR